MPARCVFTKEPFLDFPMIFGTSNVSGAGWIVPAKYYPGITALMAQAETHRGRAVQVSAPGARNKAGVRSVRGLLPPVHVKQLVMIAVPEGTTRVAMLERGEADMMYLVPGELIERLQKNLKIMLAPVLSGSWWLEFPAFTIPKILP